MLSVTTQSTLHSTHFETWIIISISLEPTRPPTYTRYLLRHRLSDIVAALHRLPSRSPSPEPTEVTQSLESLLASTPGPVLYSSLSSFTQVENPHYTNWNDSSSTSSSRPLGPRIFADPYSLSIDSTSQIKNPGIPTTTVQRPRTLVLQIP
jgi:hypothetical protein